MCSRGSTVNHLNELNISGTLKQPRQIENVNIYASSMQNRSNITFTSVHEQEVLCSVLFSGFWVGTGVFHLSECCDSFPVFYCKNSHQHFEQKRSADLKPPPEREAHFKPGVQFQEISLTQTQRIRRRRRPRGQSGQIKDPR